MEVTVYKVTVLKGFYAHETGTSYSFHSWGQDTDQLKGYDHPLQADLAEGYEVGESLVCELLVYPGGYSAEEALALGILTLRED